MQNCTVARFDAHCQVHNLLIKNSVMEHINTIGFGKVIVEDTEIWDHYIFNLRTDYGSTFCGDYELRNVKMMNTARSRLSIFWGGWINHNYGYTVHFPQNVTIENMTAPEGAVITVELSGSVNISTAPTAFSATVTVTYGYTSAEVQISGTVSK